MDRDCNKCINHISVSSICSKWNCEMETLEEHDKKVRARAFEEVYNRIDEGVCYLCEHRDMDNLCYKKCNEEDWEKETIMKWLKEQIDDHNN